MKSDAVKKGVERAPHRSLLRALGNTQWELEQPFVGIVNSYSEVIPGHVNLQQIAAAVKAGVRAGGGTPFEVGTIGVCDGIAMNHSGMKYSLASRELVADSVEAEVEAPIVIRGDRQLLGQAIANLIDNALKYGAPSAQGGNGYAPEVGVQAQMDSDTVEITVSDRGPGVPAAERELLPG